MSDILLGEQVTGVTVTVPAEDERWKNSTAGTPPPFPPLLRVKSLREQFINWLIGWMLPGFHLTKNPPKGLKRTRKEMKDGKDAIL